MSVSRADTAENLLERARRYLCAMPPATAGCGGDLATYRAAAALVKGFHLPAGEALPLLQQWNASCSPPWRESELRAKLASAARSSRPGGYLLHDDRRQRPLSVVREDTRHRTARTQWPAFHELSPEDIKAIAALRGVSVKAVSTLRRSGCLWRCRWQGEECLAIRSGNFAQVRRMDGQPFLRRDGRSLKALNLPGSEGTFLNPGGMNVPDHPVLLTEGAISTLEAVEIVLRSAVRTGRLRTMVIFTAVSAGSRLEAAHLTALAGRRVQIIPDADAAGLQAAARWTSQLRRAGCTVHCARLPADCKDAGDALRRIPAPDPYWQQLTAL